MKLIAIDKLGKAVRALVVAGAVLASPILLAAGSSYPLDHFPVEKLNDQAALQNGAKIFVNYCLNCHGAQAMRYNRLQDIGLSPQQVKDNLLFTVDNVGEPMKTALAPKDAKAWFGAVPPDLSLITRARSSSDGSGSDWVYTYLRSYYRDTGRATGWNNAVYPNVGMPHVLWEMQGARPATLTEVKLATDEKTQKESWVEVTTQYPLDGNKTEIVKQLEGGNHHASQKFTFDKPVGGTSSQADYDNQIADLTAYLTFMSDPSAVARKRVGVWVLMALGVFTVFAWFLNRSFWKDIK